MMEFLLVKASFFFFFLWLFNFLLELFNDKAFYYAASTITGSFCILIHDFNETVAILEIKLLIFFFFFFCLILLWKYTTTSL